jgi:ABC-2 type transport system permease protein
MRVFNFFVESVKLRIEEQMMYKLNFIIRMITLMSFDLVFPLVTILIYMTSNGFPGWSFEQILLFQGIFIMINSIDRMFFQRVDWSLAYDVRAGLFDRYLLYPINALVYISFTNFGLEHIADFILGTGLIIYSVIKLHIVLTFSNVFLFLGFIIIGLLFILTLAILKFSIIIRVVKIGRLGEFFRTLKNYGQYPVEIYNAFLSSVFRYIIPLTLLGYIPSLILLNKMTENFFIAGFVVFISFVLSIMLWKSSLKKYTSAGG